MANDVKVTQIDVIRQYDSKLLEMKPIFTGCSALIDVQIRRIKADLEDKSRKLSRILDKAEGKVAHIEQRYNRALDECGEGCRNIIGSSDMEIRQEYNMLQNSINQINRDIQTLCVKLQNAGQRTKTFATMAINQIDDCNIALSKKIELLEKYKEEQTK